MQKTIFITGASSGLGKAAARLFQQRGWNVIATMRHPENETELTELKNVTVLKMDVSNAAQIQEATAKALALHSIDVLLNNAGYGLIGVLEALTDEQVERQLDTNLLGVIRTTRALVPHFREKKSGTIINITSMFGLVGYPTCSVYAATKFGIDGFSESLAYELAHAGVRVKVVAPGGIQTDFAGRSMEGATHDAYSALVAKVSESYNEESIRQFATAAQVAEVIYEAATDNENKLRYLAGNDAHQLYKERLQLTPEGQYRKIAAGFSASVL